MAALSQPLVHANWHRAQPIQPSQHTMLPRKEHQPEDAAVGHSRATGEIPGVDAATLLCAFEVALDTLPRSPNGARKLLLQFLPTGGV